MKKFEPSPFLNIPRWLETIIHCFIISLFFLLINYSNLFKSFGIFESVHPVILTIIIYFIIIYLFKILGTHTAVDLIEIDYENMDVKFIYYYLYFNKRKLTIKFNELSYKNKNFITILGGEFALLIYQNKKLKIKLNSSNGWKDSQIDEITAEFLKIKPPLRKLLERPF